MKPPSESEVPGLQHVEPLSPQSHHSLEDEAARWDRGAFADGSWGAAPEAIIANENVYYLRGEDGVRRAIIVCSSNREAAAYARGLAGTHRVVISHPALWAQLNPADRHAVCQLVWPAETELVILDAVSRAVIGTHVLPAVTGASR